LQPDLSPHPSNLVSQRSVLSRALAGLLMAVTPLAAQTVTTVRETEFRARWADQQVDRPQLEVGQNIPRRDADGNMGGAVADTMRSLFRTGPVVFRAGLTTGIEYTSQQVNPNFTSQPTTSSLFVAPMLAAFYDREVGPWTVSARYSIGYMHYFDRNYFAAGGSPGLRGQQVTVVVEPERTVRVRDTSRDTVEFVNGLEVTRRGFRTERLPAVTEEQTVGDRPASPGVQMPPSHTAGLDFQVTLSRLTVRSSGSASSGSGFDINRGSNQDRLFASEALVADYQLTEYTRAGLLFSGNYESNATSGTSNPDIFTRSSTSAYTDYFITGKSRLRFEVSTGKDSREFGNGTQELQTFSQAQLRANFEATAKLTFEASIGVGNITTTSSSTAVSFGLQDGVRNVFSLTTNYVPTEKLSARLYFGLEASAIQPEFSLALSWTPRETTIFSLSMYQLSGAASLSFVQNRVSRGFLANVQQRLWQRSQLAIGGGWEEYEDINGAAGAAQLPPFSFFSVSFSYQFSRWLAMEALYRNSSQGTTVAGTGGAQENRATLSLRLTF